MFDGFSVTLPPSLDTVTDVTRGGVLKIPLNMFRIERMIVVNHVDDGTSMVDVAVACASFAADADAGIIKQLIHKTTARRIEMSFFIKVSFRLFKIWAVILVVKKTTQKNTLHPPPKISEGGYLHVISVN